MKTRTMPFPPIGSRAPPRRSFRFFLRSSNAQRCLHQLHAFEHRTAAWYSTARHGTLPLPSYAASPLIGHDDVRLFLSSG